MDTKENNSSKEFHYTGDKLRQYLQHNGISYKEAARILSIDKNTVGKAVRGGNLNIDILLHICNIFQMSVTDFFNCVITDKDGLSRNYYISSTLKKETAECVSEDEFNYKKSKNHDIPDRPLDEIIEEVGEALSSLEKAFDECREKLETVRREAMRKRSAMEGEQQ